MAEIFPFRALRYNSQLVPPSLCVTQPYDKISPAMQAGYYAASPYNFVRIILGRREEQDNTEHNVYTRAAADFRNWRASEVLRQDAEPCIYAYSERFKSPGTVRSLSAGDLSRLAGSRIIRLKWCSVTSRHWRSLKLTGWTCCARRARILDRSLCCMRAEYRFPYRGGNSAEARY